MKRIDLAYLPIIGRGEQINIICAMHDIEVNHLLSTPLGDDFDKDKELYPESDYKFCNKSM